MATQFTTRKYTLCDSLYVAAFIAPKLQRAATACSSAALRCSPRCAATRATSAGRSALRSSKCTSSTQSGWEVAASHQPECHSQMLLDSTLPSRKSGANSSQPPRQQKPGMLREWCSIDTAASFGLRLTTITLAPAAAAAAGPPRHGAALTGACVFHTRRPLSASGPGPSAQSASQPRLGVPETGTYPGVAVRETAISSQGASFIGSQAAPEPRISSMQICCIHVVPHFGYVAMKTSCGFGSSVLRSSYTASRMKSKGWMRPECSCTYL